MEEETPLQAQESWSEETNGYSPKRARPRATRSRLVRVLIGLLALVVFIAGVVYFLSRPSSEKAPDPIQMKMAAFEQKIAALERQMADLQGKSAAPPPDPALLQRLEALSQRLDALEKRNLPATTEPKAKAPATKSSSTKPSVSVEKRYHIVQKGETLYRISKKYGTTVEKLRKLNNLSPERDVRPGQKLLLPPEG